MAEEERGEMDSNTPWARELVIKLTVTVVCSRGEKQLLRNWSGAEMSQGKNKLWLLWP